MNKGIILGKRCTEHRRFPLRIKREEAAHFGTSLHGPPHSPGFTPPLAVCSSALLSSAVSKHRRMMNLNLKAKVSRHLLYKPRERE